MIDPTRNQIINNTTVNSNVGDLCPNDNSIPETPCQKESSLSFTEHAKRLLFRECFSLYAGITGVLFPINILLKSGLYQAENLSTLTNSKLAYPVGFVAGAAIGALSSILPSTAIIMTAAWSISPFSILEKDSAGHYNPECSFVLEQVSSKISTMMKRSMSFVENPIDANTKLIQYLAELCFNGLCHVFDLITGKDSTKACNQDKHRTSSPLLAEPKSLTKKASSPRSFLIDSESLLLSLKQLGEKLQLAVPTQPCYLSLREIIDFLKNAKNLNENDKKAWTVNWVLLIIENLSLSSPDHKKGVMQTLSRELIAEDRQELLDAFDIAKTHGITEPYFTNPTQPGTLALRLIQYGNVPPSSSQ